MNNIWWVIAASVLGTYFWRVTGMMIASRLKADSPLSWWFTCVAYAVLAGFIASMLLLPGGSLDEVPIVDKVIPLAVGLAALLLTKRNIEVGTVTAFALFVAIALWRSGGGEYSRYAKPY